MKNAIILHGLPSKKEYYSNSYPSSSNSFWFPWLQKQLMINDIKADTPEVPYPYDFDWNSWVKEVERFEITPETILVGHSMGGGFWLRYLSDNPEISVDKLVLVAPWLNLMHEKDTSFFDFQIDPTIIGRVGELIIFASDNDSIDVQNSVNYVHEQFPSATFKMFHDYGHFTLINTKTGGFPELLDAILKS